MTPHVETQYQYVIRKLNEKKLRISKISEELGLNLNTLYAIQTGTSKNPSVHTIQALHDYFRKAGE